MDANPNPFRQSAPCAPLALVDGALAVPAGPGLGIELDVDWLLRSLVRQG